MASFYTIFLDLVWAFTIELDEQLLSLISKFECFLYKLINICWKLAYSWQNHLEFLFLIPINILHETIADASYLLFNLKILFVNQQILKLKVLFKYF